MYTSKHPSSWFEEGWGPGKKDVTATSKVAITKGMDMVDVRLPSAVGGHASMNSLFIVNIWSLFMNT